MNAVRSHVPCGARLLANRRSNAVFETLTGRESVLEGMAPYLRPPVLDRVLGQIAGAEHALAADAGALAFLRREQVGYVVLLPRRAGDVAAATDRAALARAPWLTRVHVDPSVTIYRVSGAPQPGRPPPGYDCTVPAVQA
jgi:hypothetical protein